MTSGKRWFSFNFNPTAQNNAQAKQEKPAEVKYEAIARKRGTRKENGNDNPPPLASSFFDTVAPACVDDLPVHAKKIAEVSGWLDRFILQLNVAKKTSRNALLLITGPTGCAKTATVNLLCRQKAIDVVEWSSPSATLLFHPDDNSEPYMRQSERFLEFLIASSFPSLLTKNQHRVCLVKDFPNVFLQKPAEFHELLDEMSTHTNINVIFVVTDLAAKSLNIERNLFPEAVKLQHNIGTISFNGCAATFMKKAACRAVQILKQHPAKYELPPADVIDAVCASSMGDIRCCINQLYFASLKSAGGMPAVIEESAEVRRGSKRRKRTKSVVLKAKLKDEALGLFHSIGRVLNPKVDPTTRKIQCDLGALIGELSAHPLTIVQFLFQNYLEHFGELADAMHAGEMLSTAVSLMETPMDSHELPMTLAVMGLMLANKNKVSKWNPIRAPPKLSNEDKLKSLKACEFLASADHCYVRQIKGEPFNRFEANR